MTGWKRVLLRAVTATGLSLLWAGDVRAQAPADERPLVLMLIGPRSTAPGLVQLDAAFRRGLNAAMAGRVDYAVEYLDLPDGRSSTHADALEALLRAKYGDRRPGLVAVAASPALTFVLERRERLFADAPILHIGNSPETLANLKLPAESTGVVLQIERQRTVDLALTLHPEARRLVIVAGGGNGDKASARLAERLTRARAPTLEIVSLAGVPLVEQLRRVAELPRDSVIIFTSYRADAQGRSTVAADLLPLFTRAATAPMYGAFDLWLGLGIVGGDLLSWGTMGQQAGDMAARILSGTPAQAIPPVVGTWSAPAFDWRQIRRWGIDQSRLPAGSSVQFREFTFWERYRWGILGVLAALTGQGLLIGFLLAERRSRRHAQADLISAEQRYRTVADFTADWEYWIRPDRTFAYSSPSCLAVTGWDVEAFTARPSLVDDIVVEEDRPLWRAHRLSVKTAPGPASLQFRITKATGETRWLEHVCTPVTGADGTDLGIRGSNRDITERKHAEEQLRRAFDEIERLRERLEVDNSYLREQLDPDGGPLGVIGVSDGMRYVLSKAQQVASTETTVLLLGETGVGKSLIARTIHQLSPRKDRPLVTLNCAALPAALVESELFGHERGAFTGAHALRRGRFEVANGSTLFLDEIGDLPLDLQGKLLRAIQDGEFERVGGNVTLRTNVRLIAATNRRLDEDVTQGRFRQDLWYRVSVFPITVPPLRQRRDDIPALVGHFVGKHCRKLGRPPLQLSRAAMKALQARDWPGNIRELENVVERAVISSQGGVWDLTDEGHPPSVGTDQSARHADDARTLEAVERDHIVATLDRVGWRVTGRGGAAEALAINASTLRSRMLKLGIQRPRASASSDGARH